MLGGGSILLGCACAPYAHRARHRQLAGRFLAEGRALATHPVHHATVERAGLAVAAASGMSEPGDCAAFTARAFHSRRGLAFVVRDFAAADVRASHAGLVALCADANLRAISTLTFAGQILSETLAAVHANATFLRNSLAATLALGWRAVLFTGSAATHRQLPRDLPSGIVCVEYAPHAAVFPHAAVVVHHGDVGISAEVLHAGVPWLVVPHGFDQHDNVARLRLGVVQVLPARRNRAARATGLLQALAAPSVRARASALATTLGGRDGAARAVDVIEAELTR